MVLHPPPRGHVIVLMWEVQGRGREVDGREGVMGGRGKGRWGGEGGGRGWGGRGKKEREGRKIGRRGRWGGERGGREGV